MERRALLIALSLFVVGGAQAQRRSRTLSATERDRLTFSVMIAAHVETVLGNLDHLAPLPNPGLLGPAVYVTITKESVMVWDEDIVALEAGVAQRADLANCPLVCIPKVLDAISGAVVDELDRLRRRDLKTQPQVLLIADKSTPFKTVLAVAYSIAYSTSGAPPPLHLAVRLAGATAAGKVGTMRFFVMPAHAIKMAENANPLLAHVSLESGRFVLRARKGWLPWPETTGSIQATAKILGELKARDPNKTVAFVTLPGELSLERALEIISPVRTLYPDVMIGAPRITGPVE